MGGGGGSSAAADESNRIARERQEAAEQRAAEQRQREQEREARIREGMTVIGDLFGRFDDDFFGDRRQSFLDFALPEVDRQREEAAEDLTLTLGRQGLLGSSVAADREADLQRQAQEATLQAQGRAREVETEARNAVSAARDSLVQQLNASADPEAVQTAAAARIPSLAALPRFEPLGPLFAGVTNGLAAALEGNRRRQSIEQRRQALGPGPIEGQGTQKVLS